MGEEYKEPILPKQRLFKFIIKYCKKIRYFDSGTPDNIISLSLWCGETTLYLISFIQQNLNRPIDVFEIMQHTTMNWAFGYKFGCLESEETPHIIRYCVSFPSNISLINRLHIESNRKFMNVIEEFDGFIFDIIEIREIKLRKIPIKVIIYLELGINTDVKQLRDEMQLRCR
ncbi:hypothetical protein GLOIN_2v1774287 [Rhizophagus irregularis DAOM 181602=DAOM 197198]|uniref:Uncharacterized protein n=1 Tax=Rhizophagus irregularis (strain DAOM 181602 / DAOM 197198 / MUCL 43194) TaxID=747089 RepID=A0A2P4Q2L7_RHIID|nr:hypothetical protein GLOIN_2v1774287 [Rhizophagus irregularis DAOM 181602=DAOM 197198]POG71903.1 hypothetical protein GLOIN_2v1774287 [Rhizophagus irregularis DAOM 181602=DAOM 197198]|eukprot:XP_025178769.1 hypothetical protein GLOIN_2v1774287 [Rhizophagus irregularis DAOM 181602=DAOM 197198]